MLLSSTPVCDHVLLMGDSSQWGGANIPVFVRLLRSVIEEINSLVGVCPNEMLLIQPDLNRGYPECCRSSNGSFIIFLSARGDNNWGQFVYQFAHEYCHRIINGPMDGELETTFWFEESICEMSSLFLIKRLIERWGAFQTSSSQEGVPSAENEALTVLQHYVPLLFIYLHLIEQKVPPITIPLHEWLEANMPIISEPEYHRGLYSQIARVLCGLFFSFPDLWKMLPFLHRPISTEYSGFYDFINNTVPGRMTITIEHYPQFVETLFGQRNEH